MLSHQSAEQIQRPGSHSTLDQSARNADGLPSDCERARARDGLTTHARQRERKTRLGRKTTSFPSIRWNGKQFWPGSIIALIPCKEKTEFSVGEDSLLTHKRDVKQQADCTTSIQWNNIKKKKYPYTQHCRPCESPIEQRHRLTSEDGEFIEDVSQFR